MTLAEDLTHACRLSGRFELRSGAESDHYFDKYRFEADPELLARVTEELAPLVPHETEILAGLELGGVPLATALSLATGLPARFVRKAAKPYGTRALAEGGEVAGRRVVLVEDVVTTGGAILEAAQALRELGADVDHALCVIRRDTAATEHLGTHGILLAALYDEVDL